MISTALNTHAELLALALAGIYQIDRDGKMQCCLITTEANGVMRPVHDRMPVLFNKETGRLWLEKYDSGLLVPYDKPLEIKKAG